MNAFKARLILAVLVLALVAGCGATASPTATPPPSATVLPSATPLPAQRPATAAPTLPPATATIEPTPQPASLEEVFALISREQLFGTLEDLEAIQPYSGWRSSATEGEAEALDAVAAALERFAALGEAGMTLERQQFHVPSATELWETRLHLTLDGQEVEVPADGIRGHQDNIALALRSDSDGRLNDTQRDPVVLQGPVVRIGSVAALHSLSPDDAAGKIAFVDYVLLDRVAAGSREQAGAHAAELLALRPAGLVLITRFSNEPGESHGSFVGDSSPTSWVEVEPGTPIPPTLYVRLEDLAPAGVERWEDLDQVEAARLTWDADVLAPGSSGNLIAHIPGASSAAAVILGAHIDTPNSPGAMDDGSGSAVLLEVARVLNEARIQPPVDLTLAWFGSEELGAYGSAHFVATHQELLDRTLGMLQIDCLTHPLERIPAKLTLTTWSYGRQGDRSIPWPDYVSSLAGKWGVETVPQNEYAVESDNGTFAGFGVPNTNLIYKSGPMGRYGPIHYAAQIHDPYDTAERAREVGDVLEGMAQVALAVVLETGVEDAPPRVAPEPDLRALFVASHTEAPMMTPIGLTDLGQTLALAGFDVDLVPYGQAVTAADLEGAALVFVPAVVDFPSQRGDLSVYDEAWSEGEIQALEDYVATGGLLVLANSAHRLKFGSSMVDANEDWRSLNALSERFGISYRFGTVYEKVFWVEKGSHPLVDGVSLLELLPGNSVPIRLEEGQVLGWAEGRIVIGLVDYGDAGGQVLALADAGLLGNDGGTPRSL
ncbi:MAG: M28 family peptidase, partial [Anaerolineae bacterium]